MIVFIYSTIHSKLLNMLLIARIDSASKYLCVYIEAKTTSLNQR